MNDLIVKNEFESFNFEGFEVRIKDIDGKEWIIADDIAKAINHSHTPTMCKMVDDEYKNTVSLKHSIKGNPNKVIISEPGLFQIFAKSKLPKTKPFQKWLYEKMLPTFRKTGSYSIQGNNLSPEMIKEAIKEGISAGLAEGVKSITQNNSQSSTTVFHVNEKTKKEEIYQKKLKLAEYYFDILSYSDFMNKLENVTTYVVPNWIEKASKIQDISNLDEIEKFWKICMSCWISLKEVYNDYND